MGTGCRHGYWIWKGLRMLEWVKYVGLGTRNGRASGCWNGYRKKEAVQEMEGFRMFVMGTGCRYGYRKWKGCSMLE